MTREGVFVGAELVTWVMSAGEVGKEEGRGVCEGLLRLGVLQKVGSGEEGEPFSSGARYTWTGEVPRLDTQPRMRHLFPCLPSVCVQLVSQARPTSAREGRVW